MLATLLGFGIAIVLIVVIMAIIKPFAKKFKWGLNANPVITLRPGETRIASMSVSWKHKAFYLSRYSIPQGTLDITDQRVVFTALTGKKVDFELPLQDISSVRSGLLFVDIRTKSRESYLLGTYWKKELMGYLKQAGAPVEG